MTTLTEAPVPAAASAPVRRTRLRGLNWLVWRQHRVVFWTLIACTVVFAGVMIYERAQTMDYLNAHGWPHLKSGWSERYDAGPITYAASLLGFVPIVAGVFVGAPLLAGDLESGTAKLVASQSVSRVNWIAKKLGITVIVVAVCGVVLSTVFTWWWSPVKSEATVIGWSDGSGFDNSGPMLVALTLLTLVGGVAIGLLLRRTLSAMVVTFAFSAVVQLVWSEVRLSFGSVVTATTHKGVLGDTFPHLPAAADVLDQSYLTGSGKLIGYSTCVHEATEKAQAACLQKADVVGWSVKYLPLSGMSGMQWLGAGALLVLTAAIAVFVIQRARKRVL
jgi:ABC-type transport system involved in multi-copper enzyme maturation permease subunit